MDNTTQTPYLEQPFPLYFLVGLFVMNVIALFQIDFLYIGAFLSFIYIVITPGFLILPLLTPKKFAPALGIAFSVALSILSLMLLGLILNTVLPLLGMKAPLTTTPLLITFDVFVYALLMVSYKLKKTSPFELHTFNTFNSIITGISLLLPLCACLGAIMLNNGGTNIITMAALILVAILVPVVIFSKDKLNHTTPPVVLFSIALSFLLMNSMRGWYITGHDILLEYHVFILTNAAHLWSMSFFQDPYNACLSLTILPTYLVQLLHVDPSYIYKFFIQFIGALPVILVYYLAKEYVSEKIAFLAAFLYISFPTFMVDMAFLNRQGIAFLFFGALIFTLLTTEHFQGWKRYVALFTFGIGVIVSHYSSSYITVALLLSAYVLNRIMRFIVLAKWPRWLFKLTEKLGNKDLYRKPILLTLPFTLGLLALMIIWSTFITKTSTSFFDTIHQIISSVEHPFSGDASASPAKFSLFGAEQPSPDELLSKFVAQGINSANVAQNQSAFYPLSVTEQYPTTAVTEMPAPITPFGSILQSILPVKLTNIFDLLKQLYAKIVQIVLLIGLVGMMLGYSFKKNLLRNVPIEYIALSVCGLIVIAAQTILPASAIDYGLYRLFQQNLAILALPIILGLVSLTSLVTKKYVRQLMIYCVVLLFFFVVLSGLIPQITGGGRPALTLNNTGLYYDSYYMHKQEVLASQWIAEYGTRTLPIQAAHFSDLKILAYGRIGSRIELIPQTTKRDAYVYLNFDNVKTSNILEILDGYVVYYHFPMPFLEQNKDLIYNNGGSEIYR